MVSAWTILVCELLIIANKSAASSEKRLVAGFEHLFFIAEYKTNRGLPHNKWEVSVANFVLSINHIDE